jgi:hypothetical protein
MTMYLVLPAFTSSLISLVAATTSIALWQKKQAKLSPTYAEI